MAAVRGAGAAVFPRRSGKAPRLPGAQGDFNATALRGKRVAVLPPEAYGGHKDARAAWAVRVLAVGAGTGAASAGPEGVEVPEELQELWAERAAIMVYEGQLPPASAERVARAWLQPQGAAR